MRWGRQQNCEPQVGCVSKDKQKEVAASCRVTTSLRLLAFFSVDFPARERLLIKASTSCYLLLFKGRLSLTCRTQQPLPDSILGFLTWNWAGLFGVHTVGLSQGFVGVWAPDFGSLWLPSTLWLSDLVQNVRWFSPSAIYCTWLYFISKKDMHRHVLIKLPSE